MIKVAIVGAGGIAGICHVPALRAQAHRAEIVAAVDVDAGRVQAFAAEHRIPAAYTSLAGMLDAERPDLVHVCTPPHLHAAQVVECLRAGAWVWCEKPVCLTLAEHDTITAAERGAYASVVSQHRFGSGARHLRDLVAGGVLGRPLVALCVTAWYRDHAYFDVPWRGGWATEGGGPTMGHGIHQMDVLLSVLGRWSEVRAMAGTLDRRIDTEDVSMAAVRFARPGRWRRWSTASCRPVRRVTCGSTSPTPPSSCATCMATATRTGPRPRRAGTPRRTCRVPTRRS
ncbi:Gfo/Idh/MocA family oxidoreductase [Microtetraspora sp. AC03309]|uniref:Gfo/Idh/MocA family protein n=1 Tax=Microtetraspora sp. AC03309 TaxID=2779376 RepID=UPI0027E0862B|nr:Gfo/Idh/MocA family oxidoreductase [Microtetraspora sp. AC03309]